ncbi:hypothetical protein SAMN00768000_0251 [Sulfobacillus thermosulfidooxidans DSM 9293]|uniref:Uncharacterized protein n=1 Tax=Sulfobacillus thermosulfidooxidans (strain DSM 9293 / VKM B-1269 / AT-1) TaxID=929705 RepID=A0A1W1W6W1_SULTA|nr:hypothetical protein [Sulfobacillus thermosulfidooxidans]SMC02041.1 hypothetical protein SAMN00768000_0251 [Sulfobacillus thermosulfidooxidans DSM 9293]
MTQRSLVDSDQLAIARATTYAADPVAQAAFMHGFRSQWAQLMAHLLSPQMLLDISYAKRYDPIQLSLRKILTSFSS